MAFACISATVAEKDELDTSSDEGTCCSCSAVLPPIQTVIEQGGLQPGGLNFDAKVRRESTALEDLFIAHIGAMDAFSRGLRNAVRLIEDGLIPSMVKVLCLAF